MTISTDSEYLGAHPRGALRVRPVAYLSAEFGLHESLPIYSGGLGVLAGDHLKSASDLGLPLVGGGALLPRVVLPPAHRSRGLAARRIHSFTGREPARTPARGADGHPVMVEIQLSNETLRAQVWEVHVGRNTLLLLDTDVEGNSDENRQLAARLYFGDQRVRIRQELLLGVGGIRALAPAASTGAFCISTKGTALSPRSSRPGCAWKRRGRLQDLRARSGAEHGLHDAHAGRCRSRSLSAQLVDEHLEPLRQSIGLTREEFVGLGRIRPEDHNEALCMTVLAFKMSRYANGVSALHGRVTRKSWQVLWPHHREDEVPLGHITNGVHVRTWLAPRCKISTRSAWGRLARAPHRSRDVGAINNVHDAELWETHRTLKADLVHFIRRVCRRTTPPRGYPDELVAAETALDPDALTIGFARRFATYKRANMIFHDMPRLIKLLTNPERPVQLVFAGKAHPADGPGKKCCAASHEATMIPSSPVG